MLCIVFLFDARHFCLVDLSSSLPTPRKVAFKLHFLGNRTNFQYETSVTGTAVCCYRACIKKMGTQEAELFVLVLFLSKLKSTGSTLKLRQPYEGTSLQKRLRRKKKIKVYCYSPITQWKTSTSFNQSINRLFLDFLCSYNYASSVYVNRDKPAATACACAVVFIGVLPTDNRNS